MTVKLSEETLKDCIKEFSTVSAYSVDFYKGENKYQAVIQSVNTPDNIGCLIFPYEGGILQDWKAVYHKDGLELSKDALIKCVDEFKGDVLTKEINTINIKALLPLLPDGFVAMHENGVWSYFPNEPECMIECGEWNDPNDIEIMGYSLEAFDIEEAEDWTKSLLSTRS